MEPCQPVTGGFDMEQNLNQRCLGCGRALEEEELYCYFCELDLLEMKGRQEKEKERHSGKNKKQFRNKNL